MIRRICCVWLMIALSGISPAANAVLGAKVVSTDQDTVQSKASSRSQQSQNFKVVETTTPAGTTVREYADAEGRVFAITWNGPLKPDLRQLLGPYFPHYISDSNEQSSGHARRTVRHEDLVVHSLGRMRAFSGKAYLQSVIPNGVEIDSLQ